MVGLNGGFLPVPGGMGALGNGGSMYPPGGMYGPPGAMVQRAANMPNLPPAMSSASPLAAPAMSVGGCGEKGHCILEHEGVGLIFVSGPIPQHAIYEDADSLKLVVSTFNLECKLDEDERGGPTCTERGWWMNKPDSRA